MKEKRSISSPLLSSPHSPSHCLAHCTSHHRSPLFPTHIVTTIPILPLDILVLDYLPLFSSKDIILEWVTLIPSILSVCGCLFIILSYFTFIKLQSSVGRFILWFALSGLGNALYPFFGSPSDGTVICYLQSMIGTYFLLSNVFTSTILSHLLYCIFYIPSYPKIKISRYHYLFSWGLPLIFTALPFITDSYGREDRSHPPVTRF